MRDTWAHAGGALAGLGLLLLALASGGCGDDPAAQTALPCTATRDCPGGQFCGCGGFCFTPTPCQTSDDCCANETCSDGLCLSVGECATEDDCRGTLACTGCACVPRGCRNAGDCWPDELCEGGVCLADDRPPCRGECGESEVCDPLEDECLPRPDACAAGRCGPGESLILVGVDEHLGPSCSADVECACATARAVPPGAIGTEMSVVRVGDVEYVAFAHDHFYGDLVAVYLENGVAIGLPDYIDGVPEAQGANPTGLRGGLYAAGPARGAMPSAAARDGTVAVTYRDLDAGTLRFARQIGSREWELSVVDATVGAGWYADLVALPDGRYVVAYLVRSGANSELRLAQSRNGTPLGPADWNAVTLEAGEGVLDPAESVPLAVAVFVALDVSGPLATVVYYDSVARDLRAARGNLGGTFTVSTLDTGAPRSEFDNIRGAGLYPALARAPNGTLAIAFVDTLSGEVRYGELGPGEDPEETVLVGEIEVIDPGRRASPPNRVGADLQLVFDPNGRALAVYQDASEGDLLLALRGPVDWERTAVLRSGVAGFSPHLFTRDSPFWVVQGVLQDDGGELVESIDARSLPAL